MSTPQAKRKVMGRIDLSNLNDGANSQSSRPQSANRTHTSSPALGFSNGKQTPKAKVNVNSIVNGSASGAFQARPHISASSGNSSPSVRSPYPSQTALNPISTPPVSDRSASISPATIFHVRNADNSASSSRTTTRSPSPSKMYTGAYRSTSNNVSNGLQSQNRRSESPSFPVNKPKVRPTSFLQNQDGTLNSLTARTGTPTITAKVSPLLSDSTPKVNHVRVSSNNAHIANNPTTHSPQLRSRSPSPILTKANSKDARRISYGSNVSHQSSSTSGTPSVSGTQRNSIGRSSFSTAPPRPSLVSMTSQFTNVSIGDAQNSFLKSGPALESPVELSSPSAAVGSPRITSLTSPTTQGYLSSPPIIHSPTVELGVEQIEAKTNRKILDLEITNKSLLAINSGLEVVKLKQAREIRDLKRRLREGRTLGESLGLRDDQNEEEMESDLDDEEEEESVIDEEAPLNAELEEAHQRCKGLIDAMVAQARQAILSKYEPEPVITGNRVLHPAEVVEMQNKNETLLEEEDEDKSFGQEDDQSLPYTGEDRSRFLDGTIDTTVSQSSSGELESQTDGKVT